MADLKLQLTTLKHAAMAAYSAVEAALSELESIAAATKAEKNAKAPVAAALAPEVAKPKAAPAPKAPKAPKAAPAPKAEAAPVIPAASRVLAGFTINPPANKGERMNLPSKEEITKKALSLGVTAEKIAEFFPKGAKPSNEMKLKFLEHLNTLPAPVVAAPAPEQAPANGSNGSNGSHGVKTLAGFTITPPANKGERMNLPSKEEIAKKAVSLGATAEQIAGFFPAGAKPTNEMKLKVLEQLDGMSKTAQPSA